jgi:hypothetical protein
MDGGGGPGLQHGGLGQWIGWHSNPGCGQQGGRPWTLPTRTHTIATINTTNFMNIFKRFSIITKLRL